MKTIVYDHLPDAAKKIREDIFLHEQGFQTEFDDIDAIAKHILLFQNGQAIGTCRVFWNETAQSYIIGRVAVVKSYRGKGIGNAIMLAAENLIRTLGGTQVQLSGQVRAAPFYEQLGYVRVGEEYMDEFCPHITLKKTLV